MSGDIVERLRRISGGSSVVERLRRISGGSSVVELARDAAAEIVRLRAERYVDDLGVDWCVLHNGVRNEDSDRCDAFDWSDEDDMLDEDGEYLPCDLRPLVYRETERLQAERDASRLTIGDLTAEVERLRAAGDALAKWLWRGGGDLADMIAAVAAWEEVRRERP